MVRERRGGAHWEEVDGEVPTALENIGEEVLVVLDGNGIHDSLQEVAASPKVWATILGIPCNGGKGRLEVRPRPCHAEHGGVQRTGADLGNETHTRDLGGQGRAGGEI
jgi:hypothetical protein